MYITFQYNNINFNNIRFDEEDNEDDILEPIAQCTSLSPQSNGKHPDHLPPSSPVQSIGGNISFYGQLRVI